jgi:hypothetical protein
VDPILVDEGVVQNNMDGERMQYLRKYWRSTWATHVMQQAYVEWRLQIQKDVFSIEKKPFIPSPIVKNKRSNRQKILRVSLTLKKALEKIITTHIPTT